MGAERKHSAGWYAGALVFWLLSAWLITVGLSSIIPQIFWPAGEVQAQAGACQPGLRQLRRELLQHAGESFSQVAPDDRARQLRWFERWDRELALVQPSCEATDRDAATELNRVRHGLATLIERFDREQAPRIERLDALLGHASEARFHPPQGEDDLP